MTGGSNSNRGVEILKLLWARFIKQPWQYKLITLALLIVVFVWMVIFYSSFLLWHLFSFILTKPLLHLVEWYLKKTA
uniref:Uncharacterized protein n=1 Tax=Candidatus Berkiella aquae TaxID=295108 RepID=A0A0Q9YU27_9GAMM